MSREIIFRGQRKDDGAWVYGWYTMYPFMGWPLSHCIIPDSASDTGYLKHVEVDPATVGQYTGMNDKNGMRVFEGDILDVRQGRDSGRAIVGFENGAFVAVVMCGDILERTLYDYWYNDWDIEVIGNIHDNDLEGVKC